MDSGEECRPKTPTRRHKCSACFKQYKEKEHLIEHMRASYHSVHQPKCGVCQKHCKTFESLREHITGPLCKTHCSVIFSNQGCSYCMKIFDSPTILREHKELCGQPAPSPLGTTCVNYHIDISSLDEGEYSPSQAIALDCEMVGGGSDGSLDLCARICLIDENENLIFHTYVQPQIPVSDYRYEITGVTEEHLRNAMSLEEARVRISEILFNGESVARARLDGGKARILVGHGLDNDFNCLRMSYPSHLLRDTANYRPLMKTNLVSHSLKYLTKLFLGYDIQSGVHDPYVDCVSAMRLYKKMRSDDHHDEGSGLAVVALASYYNKHNFTSNSYESWKPKELENMSSDELLQISRSNYICWCSDLTREAHLMFAAPLLVEINSWPEWR